MIHLLVLVYQPLKTFLLTYKLEQWINPTSSVQSIPVLCGVGLQLTIISIIV